MAWLPILIVVCAAFYLYSKSRGGTPVAVDQPVAMSSEELTAVEYFWRPG